jgi:hypothetical protein
MTPPELLTTLLARDVRLTIVGDRLRVDARGDVMTDEDWSTVAANKPALISLLRGETDLTADTEVTTDLPDGPCQLCGALVVWIENWPGSGERGWLCLACAARPVPTLIEVFATLTLDERQRLDAEAAAGDDLARAILNGLAATPRRSGS